MDGFGDMELEGSVRKRMIVNFELEDDWTRVCAAR